jgi:tetratricopeptide (TPR) repeat protein
MKFIQLLILVLLGSSCTQTLDYKSKTYQNAIYHFENENYDSTRIILLTAARTLKLPDTALHYLAICYHLKNDRDSAIYYWKKATTQNPKFELGYYNLGLMHTYNGDNNKAIEYYDKAIDIDPKSKKALYNKATILFDRNELNKALRLCERAVSADSNYVLPYGLMGQIYFTLGLPDSAYLVNSKLVELEPENPEYLFYLAISESDLGNTKKSIEIYSKSIEINPANNPSYFNRATLYHGIQKFDLAKRDYRTTLKYEPNEVECLVRLSWIYQEENQLDSMRTELEAAIKIDSTYSDAYLYLGDYYRRTNRESRACELYQKAVDLNNQRAIERLKNGCNNGENKSS